jgi:hypothetical protein
VLYIYIYIYIYIYDISSLRVKEKHFFGYGTNNITVDEYLKLSRI